MRVVDVYCCGAGLRMAVRVRLMLWDKAVQQLLPHNKPSLLSLLLLLFPGVLAGPDVDRTVIAVLGKNVSLSCLVTVPEGINVTQISWEKEYPSGRRNVAVYNPQYGPSVQEEYEGRFDFKTDATLHIDNVGFSDSGKYVCKMATFPLGNIEAVVIVKVLVEPTISLTKGSDPLVDGGNETVAAECTAAYGKPVAEISWEGNLGRTDVRSSLFPNETATILSQYKVIPTRFARGRQITCIIQHPTLKTPVRIPYTLDILCNLLRLISGIDRADGQWPEGLQQVNSTLLFTKPLNLNHSGVYICQVANDLGQRSSQKSVGIRDPPTTTAPPPTTPLPHSTFGITGLASATKWVQHPVTTLATAQDELLGTIIGGAVGGALFLILMIILVVLYFMRKRRTFRGDYYTKQYIGPSDMQKESQIDVLQHHELDTYTDTGKNDLKHPSNNINYQDYSEDVKKPNWNNVDMNHRYTEGVEIPVDYFEDVKVPLGHKYIHDDYFEDNEDDLVSHFDGSVISRREWYV
ncbi:nectin-3-like [Protopterus annectens]|uniref:nectin-3-like n=1 Tax=Protopterus annectens TaxID=7888 RepID=UPI001CFB37C2|nr:nectin-3-like [Protopterus annectens]